MKIGELAKRSGLPPSRLRFYESSGLIGAVQRKANGYREYPPQTLHILEIITCAQQAGFSLEEIRRLLPNADQSPRSQAELLASLRGKVAEIEVLQQRMAQNKAQLLAIIESIEQQPAGMLCTETAEGVLTRIRGETH
jgi:DNA-binding transcriptional MerR regulator